MKQMNQEYQQQEYRQEERGYRQEEEQSFTWQEHHQPVGGFEHVVYGPQQALPVEAPFNNTNLVAALCYSLGWFSGLVFFLFTRENRFVRFHALQSLMFFGGVNVVNIAFINVLLIGHHHMPPFASGVALLAFLLLNFLAFIGWLIAMIQAVRGVYYTLPFVGSFVTRYMNRGASVK